MTPIMQLLLVLGLLIAAAKLAGVVSSKLGQPAVLGELLAGVLLGPTAINILGLPFATDPHLGETVLHLAELGVVMLMFLAGLEVDPGQLRRVGRVALAAGTLGVIAPTVLGAAAALAFAYGARDAIFIGIILSATSVSISAQTLLELGRLRGREGVAMLGAAVVDDVLVILFLSVVVALAKGAGGAGALAIIALRLLLFAAVAIPLGVWVLPRLARWVRGLPISAGLLAFAVVTMLFYAWAAEYVGGVALITGAFLAGLLLGRTEFRHELEEGTHTLAYTFFVPIFFVSIGLQANARALGGGDLLFALAISAVAIVSKLLGSGVGARLGGFDTGASIRLGLGMISRGEVGLIVASVGIAEGLIGANVFAVMVIMVLATTLVTPPLLRAAFARAEAARPPAAQRTGSAEQRGEVP